MIECAINGQSAVLNLSNEQLQVLLTGKFGDGCLVPPSRGYGQATYKTNCIYKEYLEFKKSLLGDLALDIHETINRGYKQSIIYNFQTHPHKAITDLRNMSIEEALSLVDELGVALWIYDDGSLHKDKLFYNINTQAYSEEINRDLFVPFFNKFGIKVVPTIERKKDGREFWYLRISKFEGAFEISNILNKYLVNCYNYKIWNSETIQKWSKLQAQLKSIPVDISTIHSRTLSSLMDKNLSTEDIVRTLAKAKERMEKRHSCNVKIGDLL